MIARGTLSKGFGQILWVAPSDQGVYTITLELFPSSPPADADFTFVSSLLLSTDIFVTGERLSRGATLALNPPPYRSSACRPPWRIPARGQRNGKVKAAVNRRPDGGFRGERVRLPAGRSVRHSGPVAALPVTGGSMGPFTISIGVSFDDLASANRIVSASTSDGSFSLVLAMNPRAASPEARITNAGAAPVVIPWEGLPCRPGSAAFSP